MPGEPPAAFSRPARPLAVIERPIQHQETGAFIDSILASHTAAEARAAHLRAEGRRVRVTQRTIRVVGITAIVWVLTDHGARQGRPS